MSEQQTTSSTVVLSFTIENAYELYETVTTRFDDITVPAPGDDDLTEWAEEHLYDFTGTGKTDGDSFYDLTITAASDPSLVGKKFDWGY